MDATIEAELFVRVSGPPPANNIIASNVGRQEAKQVIAANEKVKQTLNELGRELAVLKYELALLTRILYKLHNTFRNDHGYKALRILEKSLKRYLESTYTRSVTSFTQLLPYISEDRPLLPPLALGQHVMLSIWTGIQLTNRVSCCCRIAGVRALQRLSLGHFWGVASYQLAVVARIWSVVIRSEERWRRMGQLIGSDIAPHLPANGATAFLSPNLASALERELTMSVNDDQSCQHDLKEIGTFLSAADEKESNNGINSLTLENAAMVPLSEDNSNFLSMFGTSVKRPERDDQPTKRQPEIAPIDKDKPAKKRKTALVSSDSETSVKHQTRLSEITKNEMNSKTVTSTNVINGDDTMVDVKKKKKTSESTEARLKAIHSFADLEQFIAEETEARKVARKSTMTRGLDQASWKALKKELVKRFNQKTPNKSVKQARQMIRDSILQNS